MENVRNGITDLIKAVEKEDKERNIRALDLSKSEQRKQEMNPGLVKLSLEHILGTDHLCSPRTQVMGSQTSSSV
jgi:hypothetical protein